MKNRYTPTWDSIKTHTLPSWYDDCKLGIFIHWGAYCVPAFASGKVEFGSIALDENWFSDLPYAEWYFNSMNIKNSPTYEYHIKTYGENFSYEQLAATWQAENWSPKAWAELFRKAGAGYVVLTTKHHDGLCLYETKYSDYNTTKIGPRRDILRELTDAVRGENMRMGTYYSGIIDWKHAPIPILNNTETLTNVPATYAYADYALNQVTELIDNYQPSILWNDIGWPKLGEAQLPHLLSYYYNNVPDGLINDRWNGLWHDFTTKEYKHGEASSTEKWEMCRGIGLSFGYNAFEDPKHLMQSKDLTRLLIHTTATGGNLLINVGPKADGTIPEEQSAPLLDLGRWLETNGDAIYATRCCEKGIQELSGGVNACFTEKADRKFVILTDLPDSGEYAVADYLGDIKPLDPAVELTKDGKNTIIKGRAAPNLAFRF